MDTETSATRADLRQRLARLEAELRATEAQLRTLDEAPNGAGRVNGHREPSPSDDPGADQVRSLVAANRIEEARRLVQQLVERSPTPRLERWARVLAEPVVRVGSSATGLPFGRNEAWLRKNAEAYAGKWVALRDGVLVGADEDRVALHRRLERCGDLEATLFARL
jgi:hypothetical protein